MDVTPKPIAGKGVLYFHPVDYAVFAAMLILSTAIGIYVAYRARQRASYSTGDYLMAGRSMSFGPVAFSLVASFLSSVTVLGVPAEYYIHGTMFSWFALVYLLLSVLVIGIFLPVFYDLRITSVYTYLEMRFDKWTRLAVTSLYLLSSVLYGGIVTYGPALALNRVTGLNMWGSILCTGGVCMFYTALGGLKAVIWTDVLQSVVMISGFIIVIVHGSINLGGFSNIWALAEDGGRIDFSQFGFDPRLRHSFWSILIGGTFLWMSCFGINQCQVQRYVCCRTKREAALSMILSSFGLIIIMVLAGLTGLTIYATYKDCDPLDSGHVSKADQLFPYIIVDIAGHLSGVPGLFVAGVYSSSLSTLSSGINAMACVVLEDFIRPVTNCSERTYTNISRILVVFFGFSYIILAYAASQIGGLLRMSYSMNGILGGPMLGVFTVGMLTSWVNHRGAFCGLLAGVASTVWMFIGRMQYPSQELPKPLPRTTEGCVKNSNYSGEALYATSTTVLYSDSTNSSWTATAHQSSGLEERPAIADFYSISYLHFATLGFVVTVLVAMVVSALTGRTKTKPPAENLLSPCMRSAVGRSWKTSYFENERVLHSLDDKRSHGFTLATLSTHGVAQNDTQNKDGEESLSLKGSYAAELRG